MSDPIEEAVQRFQAGFNCAQAVLSSFAGNYGVGEDVALRIAAPLGGGIARTGQTCGAVSGAILVLGLAAGTTIPGDEPGRERQYRMTGDLMTRFANAHGSTLCRDLLGCDIGTPHGRQQARDQGLFANLCPGLVADAARLVVEVLQENPPT